MITCVIHQYPGIDSYRLTTLDTNELFNKYPQVGAVLNRPIKSARRVIAQTPSTYL